MQKLLASLQQAQSKGNQESSSAESSSKPKKNDKRRKNADEKKKPKGPSVGARMQQQAEQIKRPRQLSTSKNSGGARSQNASEHHQSHFSQYQQHRGPKIPTDILDELEFRFVSNMVDYEVGSTI